MTTERICGVCSSIRKVNLMFYPCCLSRLWLNKGDNERMTIWVNRLGTMLQIIPPWYCMKKRSRDLRNTKFQKSISSLIVALLLCKPSEYLHVIDVISFPWTFYIFSRFSIKLQYPYFRLYLRFCLLCLLINI